MPDSSLARWSSGRWLFGKMPAHGDFVARGLDTAQRDMLDTWLAQEMEQARASWIDDFDTRYDTSPAWHFVWQRGDGAWTGGVLCASNDRASRRFPFVLAAPATDGAQAAGMSAGCLDLLVKAFTEGWDADMLHSAQVSPADLPWHPDSSGWALVGEDGPVIELAGQCPQGVVVRMMELA